MIEDIVILSIGGIMSLIAITFSNKQKRIKKIGLTTEGIVYELSDDPSSSFNLRYPVIRFTTLNQEWVTEVANIGMFPGFFKKGQRVTVIYVRENPKQFIINSRTNDFVIYAMLIIGLLLILLSIYKLVQVIL